MWFCQTGKWQQQKCSFPHYIWPVWTLKDAVSKNNIPKPEGLQETCLYLKNPEMCVGWHMRTSPSGPHPPKKEWFQKLLEGKSALIHLLACINMGTLMFSLQGLSDVNTWSQFGYVLNNALLLLFVGEGGTMIYGLLMVEQTLELFLWCLLKMSLLCGVQLSGRL